MSKINDGGPAFPFEEHNDDGSHYHSHPGMSLRQYYAGQALTGLLASGLFLSGESWNQSLTRIARNIADSQIQELEENQP